MIIKCARSRLCVYLCCAWQIAAKLGAGGEENQSLKRPFDGAAGNPDLSLFCLIYYLYNCIML